jgi:hypothetical protein
MKKHIKRLLIVLKNKPKGIEVDNYPYITSISPKRGSVGDSVTITGTNFKDGATVTYNSVALTNISVISDTSITGKFGAVALSGTFDLIVTNLSSYATTKSIDATAVTADFAPHNMSGNSTPSPYVASASSEYSGFFQAYESFDGGIGSNQYWLATIGSGDLQLDLGSIEYVLQNYSIQVNSIPEPSRAPKNWVFYGSTDGSNWDTLDTVTDSINWGNGEARNFNSDIINKYYRYFKISVSTVVADTYLQIGELYFYGYKKTD